ncbi:MAG: T9SS type A sorting domain-containing protein [Bacteroidia bacterium]
MKKIYTLFVLFISVASYAQVPVMGPITGPTSACSSPAQPNTYNASASNSPTAYAWSVFPSTGVIIANPISANTTINFPYSNGTYTIYCSASNGFGNSSQVTYTVNIFETPTVTFSGANTFCQGSSTALQASSTILAASTTIYYNWTPPTGLNTTSGPNVMASPNVPTTYTVTGTIGNCSNTSTITITPLASPTLSCTIQNNPPCLGQTVTVNVFGASTYTFFGGIMNGVPFTPTTSVVNVLVTGANANGCTDTLATDIFVQQPPSFTAASNHSVICAGNPAIIYANGNANTYSLNAVQMNPNGVQAASITITPTITTTYTLVGESSPGCKTSTTITQNVASCIGIAEHSSGSATGLILYPNPSKGRFVIISETDDNAIITNELGQVIKTITLIDGKEEAVSGLSEGIYFIVTSTSRKKLVVLN